jgi:hypothetical protein
MMEPHHQRHCLLRAAYEITLPIESSEIALLLLMVPHSLVDQPILLQHSPNMRLEVISSDHDIMGQLRQLRIGMVICETLLALQQLLQHHHLLSIRIADLIWNLLVLSFPSLHPQALLHSPL